MWYDERLVHEGILIVDFGSQYTLLIARSLREIGVYAEIVGHDTSTPPADFKVRGLILSGGPDSGVKNNIAKKLPIWIEALSCPILGICYGMQIFVHNLGGKLRTLKKAEYGRTEIHLRYSKNLVKILFMDIHFPSTVWMSHTDDIASLPEKFHIAAVTNDGVIGACVLEEKQFIGLQFHPEVKHTKNGQKILSNFARRICQLPLNWTSENMLVKITNQIKNKVGSGKVLIAVSGGVDSSVLSMLLHRALEPHQLQAVIIDTGLMRNNEAETVQKTLNTAGLKNIVLLQRSKHFLSSLSGITDPEKKRQIIGHMFIEIFEEYSKTQGNYTHLAQGTLYPDVIESAAHGSGSQVIKSHHNVGGLPKNLPFHLVEPLRYLFKDEVRTLGQLLGLKKDLLLRHPFPGPGLAVRILGCVTEDKVQLLQEVDELFLKLLKKHGWYEKSWQAFAVLLPVYSVGVKGDERSYQPTIALRAVDAIDGMTAEVTPIPISTLTEIADVITRKITQIGRVVYDLTSKPPGTIEWE